MIKDKGVEGLVINWSPIEKAGLHVDPITLAARAVVDATGHPCEIVKVLENKMGVPLQTETGKIMGEKSMWADVAEERIMDNVSQVYPGLYVTGMAANAVHGSPRMGPIFGGMLLSGEKVAEMLIEKLK